MDGSVTSEDGKYALCCVLKYGIVYITTKKESVEIISLYRRKRNRELELIVIGSNNERLL